MGLKSDSCVPFHVLAWLHRRVVFSGGGGGGSSGGGGQPLSGHACTSINMLRTMLLDPGCPASMYVTSAPTSGDRATPYVPCGSSLDGSALSDSRTFPATCMWYSGRPKGSTDCHCDRRGKTVELSANILLLIVFPQSSSSNITVRKVMVHGIEIILLTTSPYNTYLI
jgi:hypothetical protein